MQWKLSDSCNAILSKIDSRVPRQNTFQNVHRILRAIGSFPRVKAANRKLLLGEGDAVVAVL
jgi:hypothetical protein